MLLEALVVAVNAVASPSHMLLDAVSEALFLGLEWNPGLTTWRSMTDHDSRVVDAFARLRGTPESVERFARHLTTVGQSLMPNVLPVLASKLAEPGVSLTQLALDRLEQALAILIYSGTPRIRRDRSLRDATLAVLGKMIDAGSSRAYLMRDDLLTPLRTHTA